MNQISTLYGSSNLMKCYYLRYRSLLRLGIGSQIGRDDPS